MNEFYIDFNEHYQISAKKKIIFISFGILLIALGMYVLIRDTFFRQSFGSVMSPVLNIAMGISFLYQSNRVTLFKANNFIRITGNSIEYKFWRFQKPVKMDWININSILMKPTSIVFFSNDNEPVSMQMSYLSMATVNRIKPKIIEMAKEKNIEIR